MLITKQIIAMYSKAPLLFILLLSCAFNIQAQTKTKQEIDVMLSKDQIQELTKYFQAELLNARVKGDSTQVGLVLLKYIDLNFEMKDFKSYYEEAQYGLSLIDSSVHVEAYYYGLRTLLNHATLIERRSGYQESKRLTAYAKQYAQDSVRRACIRGFLNILSRRNNITEFKKEFDELLSGSHEDIDFVEGHNLFAQINSDKKPDFADSLFRVAVEKLGPDVPFHVNSALLRDYGNFLIAQGRPREAIDRLIESIEYIKQNKRFDLSRIGILTNISQLFLGLKQYDRALEYSDQAIALGDKNNYTTHRGHATIVNGQIHGVMGNSDLAIEKYEIAINYLEGKKYNSYNKDLLNALSLLGGNYLKSGRIEEANDVSYKIRKLAEERNFDFDNPYYLGFQSELAITKENWKEAKSYLGKTLELANTGKLPQRKIYALSALSDVASKEGDFESAFKYTRAYYSLKDSLYQSDINYDINELESQYKRKEQDNQIVVMEQESKIQTLELDQKNRWLKFAFLALGLTLVFSFFLYRLYQKLKSQKVLIEKALRDKDLLLKEIHHRVKNNLQMVSSLLTLQSREVSDSKAIAAINEGKSRVRSMALIHQNLYTQDNLTGINSKTYLEKLTNELFYTYNIESEKVKLELDIEDLNIDVDTIVPLGLIINELVTNCLKHAFPDGAKGHLKVALYNTRNGLLLKVHDNGVGLIAKSVRTGSFGNKLVSTLTEQLDGTLEVLNEEGTQTNILFKSYKLAS